MQELEFSLSPGGDESLSAPSATLSPERPMFLEGNFIRYGRR